MMKLQSVFDNLISSGVKSSEPGTALRMKALGILQLSFIMLAPVLGLFYFYVGAISLFYVVIAAGLLMVPSVPILRRTKNVLWTGNYSLLLLWATLFVLSWNTGAISSAGLMAPTWLLMGGIIPVAVFLNGYKWGAFWASLVLIQTGLTAYLLHVGYPFPNLIPAGVSEIYGPVVFFMGLCAIFVVTALFEKQRDEALDREGEKSKALTESTRYVNDILARSPVPTFIVDRQHRVIQWNRACEEMTGVSAEEVLGKRVWEGFAVDDRGSLADMVLEDPEFVPEAYGDLVRPATESGCYALEMFLPKLQGGRKALVVAAPILDSDGNAKGAIQTVQEVSPRRSDPAGAEDGLEDETGEMQIPLVFKIDSKGKISYWNRACEETLGYSSSQMLGRSPLGILSRRDKGQFKETIIKVFKGESVSGRQWKYYTKQGDPLFVLARAYPTETSEGIGKECVIVNTNVTDLKLKIRDLEAHVQERTDQLKALSEEFDLLKRNIATYIRGKEKFDPNR